MKKTVLILIPLFLLVSVTTASEHNYITMQGSTVWNNDSGYYWVGDGYMHGAVEGNITWNERGNNKTFTSAIEPIPIISAYAWGVITPNNCTASNLTWNWGTFNSPYLVHRGGSRQVFMMNGEGNFFVNDKYVGYMYEEGFGNWNRYIFTFPNVTNACENSRL